MTPFDISDSLAYRDCYELTPNYISQQRFFIRRGSLLRSMCCKESLKNVYFRSEYAYCTTLSKLQSGSTIWTLLHSLDAKTVKWKSSLQGLWVV